MKRILLLAFALLALAAPAQAEVVSKKVDQNAEAVRAYWTAERMRSARPVSPSRAGEPKPQAKPGGGSASWSTLQVNWLTAPPILKAHGKVFFSDGPYNYVCSGTALSGSSGSVVWTAGHCVNEGPGSFYTNWAFVPAYNSNGLEPYGKWTATALYTTDSWAARGEFGEDLGAARVATSGGQTLVQALGGQARALDTTPDYTTGAGNPIDAYGYPAEGRYNGQNMYLCDSYVSRTDTSTNPDTLAIPCGMNGGSSGGGWVDPDTGAVVSVNSYGYSSVKNTMFGPAQGASAAELHSDADSGL